MHVVEFFGQLDEHEAPGELGVGLLRVRLLQIPVQHRDVLHLRKQGILTILDGYVQLTSIY